MSPPLIITRGDIDRIVDIMAEALGRAEHDLHAGEIC
jgi:adenosylmethionine-8-amino-7-oxononanoate aminotransferase